MNLFFRIFFFVSAAYFAACRPAQSVTSPEILAFFRPFHPPDTLLVEIATESDTVVNGDTIPNPLFFNAIPAALLQEIDYLADSGAALVLGRHRFPLNDSMEGCWVEIRQFWFQHQALLLYNKTQKTFTDRITLAEWYGGEGGQILIGSWLFDYDGDGYRDIVRREIQHSLFPVGDTLQERTEASAALLLWKNGHFAETPVQDTAAMIRRFPIQTNW